MQDNQLVLQVDPLNDATIVPETYERGETYTHRTVYQGENHSSASRDTVTLYRSYPSKNGNFNGVDKTSVKFSQDQGVLGVDGVSTLSAPFIIEVNFSIPVGVSAAEVLKARQRTIAILDDDAIMDKLNTQLLV